MGERWGRKQNLSEPSGDQHLRALPQSAPRHTRRRGRAYPQRSVVERRCLGERASLWVDWAGVSWGEIDKDDVYQWWKVGGKIKLSLNKASKIDGCSIFFTHLHTLTLERPRKVGAIDGQPADKLGSTVMSSGWQHITHDWNGGTLISDE